MIQKAYTTYISFKNRRKERRNTNTLELSKKLYLEAYNNGAKQNKEELPR